MLDGLGLVLDEKKTAAELDLSPRTLQRWRLEGRGPGFVKLGKKVGYRREDLLAFLDKQRRTSTSDAAA
jgi:hypothetical protein